MEAVFKIQSNEFDERLFRNIKNMFEEQSVTIIITTELDETGYLTANPVNRKYLLENTTSEPTVSFTPEEFNKHVEELLNNK